MRERILTRALVVGTAAVLASGGIVGLSWSASPSSSAAMPSSATAAAAASPEPVVTTHRVPKASGPAAVRGDQPLAAALATTTTKPYGMVAVTWDHASAPAGTKVFVRVRRDGDWTRWSPLPVSLDEGPAADEEASVRDGTTPLWVGSGTGVAVQVTSPSGAAPADVRVATIDPGADPLATRSARDSTGAGSPIDGPARFPGIPAMLTRTQWGADESLNEPCWKPIYGRSAKMVFVHHTVNSNRYSRSDGPRIVRSIHAYHTQSRGWCDIGYNYLIDRYGTIYVGRKGGKRRPVRGAHVGEYNLNSVGVSMIGNFEKARPTAEMRNALVRFVGWRLGTSYKPIRGAVSLNGKRFQRISGHRDAQATACPGRYLYRWLPRLRDRVVDYLSAYRSAIRTRASRLGMKRTGNVFRGETRQSKGKRTEFHRGAMFHKAKLGAHWLSGRARRAYRVRGGTNSRLGFPRTDLHQTAVDGVRRVVFQHGRMFRVGPRRAHVLWGRILIRYRKLNGIKGRLGVPTSSMRKIDGGRKATFEHGSITWNRRAGTVTVEYS